MNVVYLCLGGNIGHRLEHINQALEHITHKIGNVLKKSRVYETEAWGVAQQQPYLNMVVEVQTLLKPEELIVKLLQIEEILGRTRSNTQAYEARTIDIDILFYNQSVISTPELTIPHPRMHLRKFVLIPMQDVNSDYIHPLLNKKMITLLQECTDSLNVILYPS